MSPGAALACARTDLGDVTARIAMLTEAGAWSNTSAVALPDLVAAMLSATDRATSSATIAAGVLHRSGALILAGFASTKRWLQNEAGMSAVEAGAILARSSALAVEFTVTRDAWTAGEITGAAVREITLGIHTALRGLPADVKAAQSPVAEQVLLDIARAGTPADVRRAAQRIAFYADPDGATAAALAAHEDQTMQCAPVGSMLHLAAYLDAEGGALVITALDQIIDSWYRTGSLAPRDQPAEGTDPESEDARRRRRSGRGHLLALALVELARRQLDNELLGSRHGVAPHVTVTVDLSDLVTGRGGELLLPGHDEPVLLPAESVRRILCDAEITTVITASLDDAKPMPTSLDHTEPHRFTDQGGLASWLSERARDVLYVGRATRRIPPRLRRALEARDRHCAFPGCRVDVSRTEAHHVREWENGGSTDLDNCVLLCSKHHHLVHEGGWLLTPTPGLTPGSTGYWTFHPPPPRTRP